jgi:arylsulfatase A-like enzyme
MKLISAVLFSLCVVALPALAVEKPNVFVIVADDMGFADVGFNGCEDIPTPHIDSLAKHGVVCTNGYVSGCVCSPTRSGLMTGRYQQRFGNELNPQGPPSAKNLDQGLALTETTFPQRMKSAGYVTGMVGKWHLGHREDLRPQRRGFDEFFGFLGGQHGYLPPINDTTENAIRRGDTIVEEQQYLTMAFGREAAAFVAKHRGQPWFLYLPFNSVHTPMHATPEKLAQFAHIENAKRRTYAAMQSAMDDAIGVVLTQLRKTSQDENTLIFFFSDNGGPLGVNASNNGGLRGKKGDTWEGGIHVPFVVQWKAQLPQGSKMEHPVIQLDCLPTALAAAGVAIDPEWKLDGVNLLPALQGDATTAPHEALYWQNQSRWAIRSGDWKLVNSPQAVAGAPSVDAAELYHLKDDPGETKNLAADQPERTKSLADQWTAWSTTLVKPSWGGNSDGSQPRSKKRKAAKQQAP